MPVQMPTLARLFDKMDEGMLIVDRDWGILYANDFARRYLNLQHESRVHEELIAKLSGRFIFDTDLDHVFAGQDIGSEWSVQFEAASRGEGQAPFVLSIYMSRPNEDGDRFLLLRDVTEERDEELWKEKFLSLISHKLMTPITTISLSLSTMGEEILGPLTPKQREGVAVCAEKLKVLERSVQRLLQYASLEKMEMQGAAQKIDAVKLTADFCTRFARQGRKKKAVIRCSGGPEDSAVVASESLFLSALDNILDNAVKFHPGPEVHIDIAFRRDAATGELEIGIHDDGPGIPPALQGEIFKEFVQRDDDFTGNVEGMGLGLPFVHHLMRIFKGRIVLESAPDAGTTVRLIFPPAGVHKESSFSMRE